MDDLISRQDAIDAINDLPDCPNGYSDTYDKACIIGLIEALPSAQKKGYTKADYIMALHKEYGCSLARAEEAHQKALEYLRNASMMKG